MTVSIEKEIYDATARKRMWEGMMSHEGWRELVRYLESRYLEISGEDCDSMRKLASRNAKLTEIRKIFSFIKHDFDEERRLAAEFEHIVSMDDQLPDPFNPFAPS